MICFPLSPSYNKAGEAWDARVPVTYLNPKNDQNVNMTVEIDTGAIYSVAPLSLATILGLPLTSGTEVSLQGVNGQFFSAYLHPLDLVIGDVRFSNVLIAISSTEDLPFLIGRTNFLDFANIYIDDVNHVVCIDAFSRADPESTPVPTSASIPVILLGVAGALAVFYFLVKK
jgi:hypothetical protein